MTQKYASLNDGELKSLHQSLLAEYNGAKAQGLHLDMSRGKPESAQFQISMPMLNFLNEDDFFDENGNDCRNYGFLDGVPEAKRLMAEILGITPAEIFVGGNSSLNLMHDCMSFAHIHGLPSGVPWGKQEDVKILCPSPGYDRHFAISEHFGYQLVAVDMNSEGPDMDAVESLIKDSSVKGIWCVPKYSNPQGITYSDNTVRRLAALKPAADDFRIFWDNAYAIHDLYPGEDDILLNLMDELKNYDNADLVFMFTSTSKVTFAGAGICALGASEDNIAWFKRHVSVQNISYDKMNQLRHARFLPDLKAAKAHMEKQADYLRPKFKIVLDCLESELEPLGIASWERPKGGYFVTLDVMEGSAKRVVQLCKEAGVVMTSAGATHPYGNDPLDRTIRIAPTYPTPEELEKAVALFCLCVKLASVEHFLTES